MLNNNIKHSFPAFLYITVIKKSMRSAYFHILQILDVGNTVSISHSTWDDTKPLSSDCIHNRAPIWEEMHAADLEHAAVVHKPSYIIKYKSATQSTHGPMRSHISTHLPFLGVTDAHAKLTCPGFHAASDHETVSWLKHMKGARHSGVGHGTNKDGHILC